MTEQLAGPWVMELSPAPEAVHVFHCLSRLPHCLYLDSALRHQALGRYSFVAANPIAFRSFPADGSDALCFVSDQLQKFPARTLPDLPPFQGGVAGLFSYDLARSLETVPQHQFDEFQTPAVAIGIYDSVCAFDHLQGRAWIISHGLREDGSSDRQVAQDKIQRIRDLIASPADETDVDPGNRDLVEASLLAPQSTTPSIPGLTSDFSKTSFLDAIQRCIDYIHAGDVFQVNLSQRLLHPAASDSKSLYLRLRQQNPATFAGYFDLGSSQIVSASPERFLKLQDRLVEARPIKGTRRRNAHPVADLFVGDDLLASQKDRAENVMIVDLLRNDLSRVCIPDSVRVTQLCSLESYAYVQHLVSSIEGQLRRECTPVDLIRAAFPGGSITGAPKVRAMEIIAELEPTARGAYCGSLGYIGFDGTMDLSILIRTITAAGGWWQIPVGGGIISQSTAASEYEETWHKAQGMLQALN